MCLRLFLPSYNLACVPHIGALVSLNKFGPLVTSVVIAAAAVFTLPAVVRGVRRKACRVSEDAGPAQGAGRARRGRGASPNKSLKPTANEAASHRELAAVGVGCAAA